MKSSSSITANVIWPSAGFSTIKKITIALVSGRTVRSDLVHKASVSKSAMNNALPIMRNLQIVQSEGYRKTSLKLTEDGEELATALKNNNEDGLNLIGERLLNNSPVLKSAKSRLVQNPQINLEILGHQLAEEFGMRWDHSGTYRNVGQHSKSILMNFGAIPRTGMRSSNGGYIVPNRTTLVPSTSAEMIFDFIKKLDREQAKPIVGSLEPSSTKTYRLGRFKSLIDLDLVESPLGDKCFRLTESGLRLKRAIQNGEESRVFAEIIFEFQPSKEVILILSNAKQTFNSTEIGNNIAEYNGANWGKETSRQEGLRFLSWLRTAGIAQQNHEPGKYRITLAPVLFSVSYVSKVVPPLEVKKIEMPEPPLQLIVKDHFVMDEREMIKELDRFLIKAGEILHTNPNESEIGDYFAETGRILNAIVEIAEKEKKQEWLAIHLRDLTEIVLRLNNLEMLEEMVTFAYLWKKVLKENDDYYSRTPG